MRWTALPLLFLIASCARYDDSLTPYWSSPSLPDHQEEAQLQGDLAGCQAHAYTAVNGSLPASIEQNTAVSVNLGNSPSTGPAPLYTGGINMGGIYAAAAQKHRQDQHDAALRNAFNSCMHGKGWALGTRIVSAFEACARDHIPAGMPPTKEAIAYAVDKGGCDRYRKP